MYWLLTLNRWLFQLFCLIRCLLTGKCFLHVSSRSAIGAITFSAFCYCFYKGFIPKIIIVSWFLLFICISYLLKIFRFDTGIIHDSFAVPLLKTLSRLPQSVAFYAWFCFTRLLTIFCNNDLLNVNRSVAESSCSLGFSCAFSWLWAN